jgi:hypothetical protein
MCKLNQRADLLFNYYDIKEKAFTNIRSEEKKLCEIGDFFSSVNLNKFLN